MIFQYISTHFSRRRNLDSSRNQFTNRCVQNQKNWNWFDNSSKLDASMCRVRVYKFRILHVIYFVKTNILYEWFSITKNCNCRKFDFIQYFCQRKDYETRKAINRWKCETKYIYQTTLAKVIFPINHLASTLPWRLLGEHQPFPSPSSVSYPWPVSSKVFSFERYHRHST